MKGVLSVIAATEKMPGLTSIFVVQLAHDQEFLD
jgi:hypothetical protein